MRALEHIKFQNAIFFCFSCACTSFIFFIDNEAVFSDIISAKIMKNKVLTYGRFLAATAVFALCVLAFCRQFYPLKIFDMQFTPALQSGLVSGFGLSALLFVFIIFLTLVFGRIYCSVLCPLGFYQELLTILFSPFYKRRKLNPAKHHTASYFIAAVLLGMLFAGSVIVFRMLDPYSIAGNALSGAAFGLGFIGALSVLVFFKKRFFCTNICPVGTVLGFVSRFSLFKIRVDASKCNICALCAKVCPCDSIDSKNHTVNNETCIKCFKCLPHCKHGALSYTLQKQKDVAFSPKRRELIRTCLVLAVFGTAFKSTLALSKKAASKIKNVIIPAGAQSPQDFANRCLNCNLCVQNCPMKIIKPATAKTPFVHINYGSKYCDFKCNKCSKVCPSGAIKRIVLKQKQNIKIANAVINEDVCIKCGICAFECPKKIIIKKAGQFPVIRFDQCIGCGKCASVCPVKAISTEPVNKQIILS